MKTLLFTLIIANLLACSNKVDEAQKPQVPLSCDENNSADCISDTTKVGPFTMDFKSTPTYENSFSINIKQDEGSVKYYTTTDEATKLQVNTFEPLVTGCDAKQVSISLYWFPDATQNLAYPIAIKTSFTTTQQVKGLLLIQFKKLEGCTKLNLKIQVTKVTQQLPAKEFPQILRGVWINDLTPIGVPYKLNMNISTETYPQLTYKAECGSGSEALQAVIRNWSDETSPYQFSAQITSVTLAFSGACSNVFALKPTDIGLYMNCLAEKNTYGSFTLGCNLEKSATIYPTHITSGTIYWKK